MKVIMALVVLIAAAILGAEYSFADQGTNADSVTFVQYLDEQAALDAILRDEIDIYNYPVSYDLVDSTQSQNVQAFDSVGGLRYTLLVNPADAAPSSQFNPFSYQEVRYALNFLVDRQDIVDSLLQGHGQVALSVFGPTHPDYLLIYRHLDALGIRHDPAHADNIITPVLEAAGAVKVDGRWLVDGTQITIKIFIRTDDPIRTSIGNSLAAELQGLGFEVEKTSGNLRDAYAVVFGTDPADFTWHLYTGAYGGSSVSKYDNSSLAVFYAPWASNMPGRNHPAHWNYENVFLDHATLRIYQEDYADAGQRANLVKQASADAVRESVRIFLAVSNDRYITNDGIEGIVNAQGSGIANRFTTINADSPSQNLTIGVRHISQSAWNPVLGLGDSYSQDIWDTLTDSAAIRDPFTGDLTPARSTWEVDTSGSDGSIDVPVEAVEWDPSGQQWKAVGPGLTAISKVTMDFGFSKWHNGVPMDINDILYPIYFYNEWGTNNSSNTEDILRYDEQIAAGLEDTASWIRVLNDTSIEVYIDYWHFDDAEIAAKALAWSSIPWEIYAAMEEIILDGDAAFSESTAIEKGIPWLSLLDSSNSGLVSGALEDMMSRGEVPSGLYNAPGQDMADRYDASIKWIDARDNAVISNGPLYLHSYSPDTQILEARAFDDPTYPLRAGHWDYLAEGRDSLEGEVTIGSLAPVTGGASVYGLEISEASKLATIHFNEYLQKRDAEWSLIVDRRDSATDTATVLDGLAALNRAGISIIDGPALDYDNKQDILEFANDNNMLLVSCCSVTTPSAQEGDSLFRMTAGHPHHAAKLASLINDGGITTIVTVGLDNIWIDDLLNLTGSSFVGLDDGNTVAKRISYGYDSDRVQPIADLAAAVQDQVDAYGADRVAVMYIGFQNGIEFIKMASQYDVLDDVRWFTADMNTVSPNITDDDVARTFAEKVELTSVQPKVHKNSITQAIKEHFADSGQFVRSPSVYTSIEYDVVWLLGLSILDAQSSDAPAVKTVLAKVADNYVGASGNTNLDAAGDREDGIYATWKIINGQWVETVEIGALIPVSKSNMMGIHRQVATEMAVSDFNQYLQEKNGKWRLFADIKDTAADADPVQLAKSLDRDGIRYVSGPASSANLEKVKGYADANNMLLVSCCSTAPSLAIEKDNVFRFAPDDTLQGKVISELLQSRGIEVLISVWKNDPFGNGLHESAAASFKALGGTIDDLGSYNACDTEGCYDDVFDDMTKQLNDKVQQHADSRGSDKVGVLFVGISHKVSETQEFVQRAADYPVLRTVQWIGSDADALSNTLTDNAKVFDFLIDTKYKASIFEPDMTSLAYKQLQTRLAADPRIVGTPNAYTYAAYDIIQVLGLAIEASGDAGFNDVKKQFPLVASDYNSALGKISLNPAGDMDDAAYTIWGIESSGWERAGTYYPGTGIALTSTVSGTVFYDDNQNWIKDASERGVPNNVMIAVDTSVPDNPNTSEIENLRTAITDADGAYAFYGVAPYPVTTLVQTSNFPEGATQAGKYDWRTYVTPQAGNTITFDVAFIQVPQEDLITLNAKVYSDDNGNGQRDVAELGLQRVQVLFHTYTIGGTYMTTDADGNANKMDLVPADFLAQVIAPAGYEATSPVLTYTNQVQVAGAHIVMDPQSGSSYTVEFGLMPPLSP